MDDAVQAIAADAPPSRYAGETIAESSGRAAEVLLLPHDDGNHGFRLRMLAARVYGTPRAGFVARWRGGAVGGTVKSTTAEQELARQASAGSPGARSRVAPTVSDQTGPAPEVVQNSPSRATTPPPPQTIAAGPVRLTAVLPAPFQQPEATARLTVGLV